MLQRKKWTPVGELARSQTSTPLPPHPARSFSLNYQAAGDAQTSHPHHQQLLGLHAAISTIFPRCRIVPPLYLSDIAHPSEYNLGLSSGVLNSTSLLALHHLPRCSLAITRHLPTHYHRLQAHTLLHGR